MCIEQKDFFLKKENTLACLIFPEETLKKKKRAVYVGLNLYLFVPRVDFKAWDINGCLAMGVFLETGVLPAAAFYILTCVAVKAGVNFNLLSYLFSVQSPLLDEM